MSMTYVEYLHEVIERGIRGCNEDPLINKYPKRLKGSIEGFEVCRCKTPQQLLALHREAERKAMEKHHEVSTKIPTGRRLQATDDDDEGYWEVRHYALQIEWVCNCVSAMLWNQGEPVIIPPTARAVINASEILGVGTGPA